MMRANKGTVEVLNSWLIFHHVHPEYGVAFFSDFGTCGRETVEKVRIVGFVYSLGDFGQ